MNLKLDWLVSKQYFSVICTILTEYDSVLHKQIWYILNRQSLFSAPRWGTNTTSFLAFIWCLGFVWWTIIIWRHYLLWCTSKWICGFWITGPENFMPYYLSGLLGMYWIKLHLSRKGTSCSSTVISPGTKYLFKFLWHWSQKSVNGANWSHFFLAFIVFFFVKSDYS